MKCSICEETIRKTEAYFGDVGTFYEHKPLCEICYYEDEPCATVLYKGDDQPYVISHTRDETDGDFAVEWRSTDPWRGYYETKSDKYSLVNTAELLAWHESEKMLGHKNINNTLRYTQLIKADDDEFVSKVAKTVEEACSLIELGYEYVTEFEDQGIKIFKKRK